MHNDIRNDELVEEVTEDLELQAGMKLSHISQLVLKNTNVLWLPDYIIAPYLKKIKEYLHETLPEERVWALYHSIYDDNSYILLIRVI